MQDNQLFEYAVIRIVPRVEREEFANVGVILYCKSKQFLQSIFTIDAERLIALFPEIDLIEAHNHLVAFDEICSGNPQMSPISLLDIASRFRWLTAKRSTILQTSVVHPGFCKDPSETLMRLHSQMVL